MQNDDILHTYYFINWADKKDKTNKKKKKKTKKKKKQKKKTKKKNKKKKKTITIKFKMATVFHLVILLLTLTVNILCVEHQGSGVCLGCEIVVASVNDKDVWYAADIVLRRFKTNNHLEEILSAQKFLFLLVSWKVCGLWLWHSLDFFLTFFFIYFFFVVMLCM